MLKEMKVNREANIGRTPLNQVVVKSMPLSGVLEFIGNQWSIYTFYGIFRHEE